MTGRYAESTSVPVERSRGEIEATLVRYGATSFAYGWSQQGAAIEFAANERRIRFTLPLPDRTDRAYTHTPGKGLLRAEAERDRAWEQACRQRWRALNLAIKAKLESVEVGISTFEAEFLAYVVLPGGLTVAEAVGPAVQAAYDTGHLPELLPAPAT